jgi:NADPH:quinone reductase-like Zn-dependent oxidoreductase
MGESVGDLALAGDPDLLPGGHGPCDDKQCGQNLKKLVQGAGRRPSIRMFSRRLALAWCPGGRATVKMPMRLAAMSSAVTSARSSPVTPANGAPGAIEEIARLVAAGQLHVPIAATFPVGQIGAAVELQAGRHVHGKVVIDL